MDDGEVELSDQVLLQDPNVFSDIQGSPYVELLLDEFLKNSTTCTHTHTCNPPGPDEAHTHTCYHTHTQVFVSEEDEESHDKGKSISKSRKPRGNREAVRKYREKKKAHTAYLEGEVKKLHAHNQQLVRRLQGQSVLEAEVLRLRTLLTDFRGKIDAALGVTPLQKQCCFAINFKEGHYRVSSVGGTDFSCKTDVPCLHPHLGESLLAQPGGSTKMMATSDQSCRPAIVDCRAIPNTTVSQNRTVEGHPDNLIPEAMDTLNGLLSSASQPEQKNGSI